MEQHYINRYMEYHGLTDQKQIDNTEYINWLITQTGDGEVAIINPDGTSYVMPLPNGGEFIGYSITQKTVVGSKIYHRGELMATVHQTTQEELERWSRKGNN